MRPWETWKVMIRSESQILNIKRSINQSKSSWRKIIYGHGLANLEDNVHLPSWICL